MNVIFEKQYLNHGWDNFRLDSHYDTYTTGQGGQTLFPPLDYFINHDVSEFDQQRTTFSQDPSQPHEDQTSSSVYIEQVCLQESLGDSDPRAKEQELSLYEEIKAQLEENSRYHNALVWQATDYNWPEQSTDRLNDSTDRLNDSTDGSNDSTDGPNDSTDGPNDSAPHSSASLFSDDEINTKNFGGAKQSSVRSKDTHYSTIREMWCIEPGQEIKYKLLK